MVNILMDISLARFRSLMGCLLQSRASAGRAPARQKLDLLMRRCRGLLVAACSPACSGSHAGCSHGICMVGSVVVAYSAPSTRSDRVCVMALRPGGARESRTSHDLHRRCICCARRMAI